MPVERRGADRRAASLYVTVPVGTSGTLPEIAAVNVTGDPSAALLDVAESAVVVANCATTNATIAEVLVPSLLSPPYVAVKLWLPAL